MLFYRYIRGEDEMTSSVTRSVGNVTKDTEITFEYGVRPEASKFVCACALIGSCPFKARK